MSPDERWPCFLKFWERTYADLDRREKQLKEELEEIERKQERIYHEWEKTWRPKQKP
jgi:hypothetical protein